MKRRWPALVALVTVAFAWQPPVLGVQAFCAAGKDGHVLVGNNEDYTNPTPDIPRYFPGLSSAFKSPIAY